MDDDFTEFEDSDDESGELNATHRDEQYDCNMTPKRMINTTKYILTEKYK